ncbi:hypothetical protein DITRI_Ditri15bG0111600 [Diplodiscus trichospermus]
MASMVLKGNSSNGSQVPPLISIQEKGSRNKREFRADPPGGVDQDHSDGLRLDLGLSSLVDSSDIRSSRPREELEADEFQDADWSDFTEAQLEELVLSNLDAIFKSAIKKTVACGYTEEIATKAVLRSGLCYGCKDTVSNIVDNTLAFLRSGQDSNPSIEHCFEDLQQLEKYILAEQVCVLREVRPFFSTGDAMWCLLICDMNVSHACAMDGDPLSGFVGDGASNGSYFNSNQPQLKTEDKTSELDLQKPCKPVPCSYHSLPELPAMGINNTTKSKNSLVLSGIVSDKEGNFADKTFSAAGTSQSSTLEEKLVDSRKSHSTKREYILQQKSLHLEKNYKTYGSKGSSRAKLSGLEGLILDKKLNSVSDFAAFNISASFKMKGMGADAPQDNGSHNLSVNSESSSSATFCVDNGNNFSALPKTNVATTSPPLNMPPDLPPIYNPPASSSADTELSLSLPTKSNSIVLPPVSYSETANLSYAGMPYDKSLGQWVPLDKRDEMILKLFLGKDKAELKTLRDEKEEVEQLKKEKLSLEENTKKKLIEMDGALSKVSGQVERANAIVRRFEVENAALRQEMEAAKLRAAELAASCQEALEREKKTLMKFQSWEKQKTLFKEELMTEKRIVAQLLQELQQAKVLQEQLEARWRQEEKLKDEKLEQEISRLRLKTDSSKIEALGKGINGSYVERFTDIKYDILQNESRTPFISEVVTDFQDLSRNGSVKCERECVMCLSEEMSVVFIPCAHQVVCTTCKELHEKQGMKDCPSCGSPIQQRIPVRYACS